MSGREERRQLAQRLLGRFLGQVMAAWERLAAHVARNGAPVVDGLEESVNDAALAPQYEQRTADLPIVALGIVREIREKMD